MKHIRRFTETVETDPDVDVIEIEDIDIEDAFEKKLVVFNDEVNTFEHVILTFMKVLNHEPEQAEQCAWIIHTKGRCVVKRGSFKDLRKYKTTLEDAHLKCAIED